MEGAARIQLASVPPYCHRHNPPSLTSHPAIHFIADDQGAFTGGLGMLFDASSLLGAPRSRVRSDLPSNTPFSDEPFWGAIVAICTSDRRGYHHTSRCGARPGPYHGHSRGERAALALIQIMCNRTNVRHGHLTDCKLLLDTIDRYDVIVIVFIPSNPVGSSPEFFAPGSSLSVYEIRYCYENCHPRQLCKVAVNG